MEHGQRVLEVIYERNARVQPFHFTAEGTEDWGGGWNDSLKLLRDRAGTTPCASQPQAQSPLTGFLSPRRR